MNFDDDLKHILATLEISRENQEAIWKAGIHRFHDLKRRNNIIETGKNDGISPRARKELLVVLEWHESVRMKNKTSPNICRDFTLDAFEVCKNWNSLPAKLRQSVKDDIIQSQNDPEIQQLAQWLPVEPSQLDPVEVAINNMSDGLIDSCNFDYRHFISESIKAIKSDESELFFVLGQTQSGKSSIKGAIHQVGSVLKCPVVVITKGVSESIDLSIKLIKYAGDTPLKDNIRTAKGGKKQKQSIQLVINSFGLLIAADTHAQIKAATEAILQFRENDPIRDFLLIVDECDSMYRTPERKLLVEAAYKALLALKPALTVMVSATMVPVLLIRAFREERGQKITGMFKLEPGDDYVSIEDMLPLMVDGEAAYLDASDLKPHGGVQIPRPDGKSEWIPYSTESQMHLYEDALRPGALLLDGTNPRVEAPGHVFKKAKMIQNYYMRQGKQFVAMVYVGKGVSVRYPLQGAKFQKRKDRTVSDVITEIDNSKEYGLKFPVFVFGYSKLQRGVSFRSDKRVPSHITLALTHGHSVEKMMQAMGRATFVGKTALRANGFDHVTILSTLEDLDMAKSYQEWQIELASRMQMGNESLEAAIAGTNHLLPAEADFARLTPRKIGQDKTLRPLYYDHGAFEMPTRLAPSEIQKKEELWREDVHQRIMYVLWKLSREDGPEQRYEITDIVEAHDSEFPDISIKKTATTKVVRELNRKNLLQKKHVKMSADEPDSWRIVGGWKRLKHFINPDIAPYEFEPDDSDSVVDSELESDGSNSLECHIRKKQKTS